jgi:hypothetical protein
MARAAAEGAKASAPVARPGTRPALHDLRSVEELRQLFDRDKGIPRVVLLLSPT